jgi:hypothetical protein
MKAKFTATAAVLASYLLVSTAHANHHIMQIEQVIAGVNGDTTAQAVQLRMRAFNQQLVSNGRVKVYDATGANPIILKDFTTNVANGVTGSRVLLASGNFASYDGGLTPDFTMTNLIPPSYLTTGGRLTFEDDFGTIWWSLAFGNYTGSNTGDLTNDADGDFGTPVSGLPTSNLQALLFQGIATAPSVNNSTDYALTSGAATFRNNAGTSATLVPEPGAVGFLLICFAGMARRKR